MAIYHIVALPDDNNLKKLNLIRHYLYTNGFRYDNNAPKNDVHITLCQINTENSKLVLEDFKQSIERKGFKKFNVKYDHITNKLKEPNIMYPLGNSWIALFFKDDNLKDLAKELDTVLKILTISATEDYIAPFRTDIDQDIYDLTANHLNLCNYALPERSLEASNYIENEAPKNFEIDKIALRDEKGKILWTIKI
jgi:hypothetical protein